MKEGGPKFTPAQRENLRRHAYLNHMADGLEKEVVDEEKVAHLAKKEDPSNPVIIKPRDAIEIFRRMGKGVYQDEIVTDADPKMRTVADEANRIREEKKKQRNMEEFGGLDTLLGDA